MAAGGSLVPVVPLSCRIPVSSQDALTSSRATKWSRIEASQARRASFTAPAKRRDLSIGAAIVSASGGPRPASDYRRASPTEATMSSDTVRDRLPGPVAPPGALAPSPAQAARPAGSPARDPGRPIPVSSWPPARRQPPGAGAPRGSARRGALDERLLGTAPGLARGWVPADVFAVGLHVPRRAVVRFVCAQDAL